MMADIGERPLPNCLQTTALGEGTITLTIGKELATSSLSYIEYSLDGRSWVKTNNVNSTTVTITTPTLASGDVVYWRGSGTRMSQNNSGYNSYCGVFSATCDYNVSGILMSLLVPNATETTNLPATYAFPRLFYKDTHVKDASGMIMAPNTTMYCYDLFFNNSGVTKTPSLPATTLANYCYRLFCGGCSSLTDSSALPALTLTMGCYYQMFNNCTKLRWIKMLATDISATNSLYRWVNGMTNSSAVVFVKNIEATWTTTGSSGIPTNWTVVYYDTTEDKYYTSKDKSQECDDHGNPI